MQGLFASLAPEKVVLGTFGVRSCVLVCAGHQLLSCALARSSCHIANWLCEEMYIHDLD